jgi:hypothetical protein
VCGSVCEFSVISWIIWNHCLFKVISFWEVRKSLPEPGQVSRVAEEAQLCSCWPKIHESVAMHLLVLCHDGETRRCFSTTISEVPKLIEHTTYFGWDEICGEVCVPSFVFLLNYMVKFLSVAYQNLHEITWRFIFVLLLSLIPQ